MKGIYFLEQAVKETQEKGFFKIIIEHLFNYKDIYELVVFVFLIILFILAVVLLIFSRIIVNKKSKYEYEKNERNHKFVNELYIELGNNNEKLRYMFHSKKWKKRIIKEFYGILHTRTGKMIAKKCKIKIYNYITLNGLYKSLIKVNDFLESLRKSRDYNDERNLMFFIEMNSFYLKDSIERLIDCTEMINNNVCFLLGKAGSGKTNLLTYFAKYLIINQNVPCIYIDAKDISNNDIESIFLSYFYVPFIINESKKALIYVLLFFKKVFRQKIVIIIEAINENSNKDFGKDLSLFINKYKKYQNVKIIVTSRTEFFELRFKDIFDEYLEKDVKYNISSIENSTITENIQEKMYLKYKKHFKFYGSITNSVKRFLYESPIFMRIFFECYTESNDTITDINKSKIFSEYISKLSKINHNVYNVLDEIIEEMLSSKKFDYMHLDKLKSSIDDISEIIYDENVLLTHSIVENNNQVNEIKKDVILITFDEMRDYLITNKLIEKHKKRKISIKNFIDEMIDNRYPILEGVLKNLYIYFKKNDINICKKILKKKFFYGYNYGNKDTYSDAHLELIFSTKEKLQQFEIDYLLKLDYLDSSDLAKMISDSSYNQLYNLEPNADFIMDRMVKFIDGEEKIYNFSHFKRDSYVNLINFLEKNENENIKEYIILLKKLLNVLEMNYYE